jgi:Mor family transcriptional regulator
MDELKEIDVNLYTASGSVIKFFDVNNERLLKPEQVIEIIPVTLDDLALSRKNGKLLGIRSPLFTYLDGKSFYLSSNISLWISELEQAHKQVGNTLTKFHRNSDQYFDWTI